MEFARLNMRHRLHSICPYFAMFPESFVEKQLSRFTNEGDLVFDPFSGRGTTLFQSLLLSRNAVAIDINPVAFCLTKAKAEVPELHDLKKRLETLKASFATARQERLRAEAGALPPFFRRAFYSTTLRELLFLRGRLRWRKNSVDTFIAALVLGSLHGEMDRSSSYFSNQMPRTICLKPDYSIRYWNLHELYPKKRDVFAMLTSKARFRLETGRPDRIGIVKQADARNSLEVFPDLAERVRLVVTSPPYLDVTRFEEDQWLRLWFLGGEPNPTYGVVSNDDRHQSPVRYWRFLTDVWQGMKPLLRSDAVLVIRIGTKSLPLKAVTRGLLNSLHEVFPANQWLERPAVSTIRGKQARAFNPSATGCQYETDFVYAPFRKS
jgi:SAM-dependent methyltransferase